MSKLKHTIFRIVEADRERFLLSMIYDLVMVIAIFASIVPLMFRKSYPIFSLIEIIAVVLFVMDYVLRWYTADIKYKHLGKRAFIRYPFTTMAIIDLLSLLPGFNLTNKPFQLLRITRLLRIVRILKLVRYSKHIIVLLSVLKKERNELLSVLTLAIGYIFITALIMFNSEQYFESFFDSLYWATTTLTTVGYGDIYPQTDLGRFISMISAIFGIAIISLPSGIITASYLEELRKNDENTPKEQVGKSVQK